jgi:uncharacterized protein
VLLIPTYVARSPIHGFGLFAAAPVKAGTVLWRLEREADWCLSPEELAAVPPRLQARLLRLQRRRHQVHEPRRHAELR